eukprot:15483119-Alexandrium_andersonii.AAC.1
MTSGAVRRASVPADRGAFSTPPSGSPSTGQTVGSGSGVSLPTGVGGALTVGSGLSSRPHPHRQAPRGRGPQRRGHPGRRRAVLLPVGLPRARARGRFLALRHAFCRGRRLGL